MKNHRKWVLRQRSSLLKTSLSEVSRNSGSINHFRRRKGCLRNCNWRCERVFVEWRKAKVGNSQDVVPLQCAHLGIGLEYCGELWWDVNRVVGEGAAQAWHLNINQQLSPTSGLYLHSNKSCHQPVVYIITSTTSVPNQWFISSPQQQLSLTSGLYLHSNDSCHQPVVYIFTLATAVTNQWFITSLQQQLSVTSGLYLHSNNSCHQPVVNIFTPTTAVTSQWFISSL